MMTNQIASICKQQNLTYISNCSISGGDINKCFAVDTSEGRFFIKVNSASLYPQMFKKEDGGLQALQQATLLRIPKTIATGVYENQQYLVLEWLEKAQPSNDFWRVFAQGLAQLHKITHTHFGWRTSNYIGSLVQPNEFAATWADFYSAHRIMPLVIELYNKQTLSTRDVQCAEKLCNNLKTIFPHEQPALVHGDLWAGNYMPVMSADDTNLVIPSVFDPAVYFGHREMDLGMSLLFGGFDNKFYDLYNEIYPLERNWKNRISLTQLYPSLVHAILFGGSYISRCRKILKEWS